MRKKLLAILIGFIIAAILEIITTTLVHPTNAYYIIFHSLPYLIAGMITGYISRQLGWMCGIIIAVLVQAIGFAVLYWVAIQWHVEINEFLEMWKIHIYIPLSAAISGAFGGLFGQLLAQKWHKRSMKKSSTSQSEESKDVAKM